MFYTIRNDALTIRVDTAGAQLMSILGADSTQYLWQGDPRYWPDRSLTIFPYVARLTQGSYRYQGKLYHMPIHGFGPTSEFTVLEHTSTSLTLGLDSSPETYAMYPFLFRFILHYTLVKAILSHSLFDDDAIVLKGIPGRVTLRSRKGTHGVTLNAPDFPVFGFWHMPKTDASYVCLEPWTSLPSRQDVVEDLEKQPDLIRLEPKNVYKTTWSLETF